MRNTHIIEYITSINRFLSRVLNKMKSKVRKHFRNITKIITNTRNPHVYDIFQTFG